MSLQMSPVQLPPMAPRRWPLIGHIGVFTGDMLGTLLEVHERVGDLYRVAVPGREIWVVNRPEDIEKIFTRANVFHKDPYFQKGKLLFGNGLLTSEGEFWLRQRRLAQPAFLKSRVQGYGGQMVQLTQEYSASVQPGVLFDIHADMMRLALRIATETLFGDGMVPSDTVGENLEFALKRFEDLNRFLPDWLPFGYAPAYRRAVKNLDRVVHEVIQRRRAEATSGSDLLSLLLNVRDDEGQGMTDKQLRDEVMTLLLAGHETTANALTWTWQLLAQNPRVEQALHAEVDGLPGDPTAADYRGLEYTNAVIQESMRLFPPAWITGRLSLEDTEIGGQLVPAGTTFATSQWVVQRDKRYFQGPFEFRPERWLDGSTQGLPSFAYFPFGGGQRLCIGKGFALFELSLVLATLARRYRFSQAGPMVRPKPSITLRPEKAVYMRASRRG